ncbi:MAG TPA: alginate export family protein [Candidatus Omnitrophota bacterium]|nr:alginate export family protein [Candidatus Omnitrophota bacterium]
MIRRIIVLSVLLFFVQTSAFAEIGTKWGIAERVRHEYWKNIFDMDNDQKDNRNFFRIKTSGWGEVDFTKELSLYAKMTNENKAYTYYTINNKKGYRYQLNEFVFDNLYLDVKNIAGLPFDMRAGRQDLMDYGEMFLFADGTPNDGSRTYYFNALKTTWRLTEKNSVDFLYINDRRDDVYLPIINELKPVQSLTTTDEAAAAVYVKSKQFNNFALEGYYIYKREGADGGVGYQAEKGMINTLGGFAKYMVGPYTLRGQLAGQFGTYGTKDRQALGGYAYIDRDCKSLPWAPKATLGVVYLSGDDRSTTKNESWDPLFSRNPWNSELYSTAMKSETGILGYWTNLIHLRSILALNPTSKMKLTLQYGYLWAPEYSASSSVLSGSSRDRGHLPIGKVEYTFNKNMSAYFLTEYFIPDGFYKDNDPSLFLRTEVMLKF